MKKSAESDPAGQGSLIDQGMIEQTRQDDQQWLK
jgi:hypothetical protein